MAPTRRHKSSSYRNKYSYVLIEHKTISDQLLDGEIH